MGLLGRLKGAPWGLRACQDIEGTGLEGQWGRSKARVPEVLGCKIQADLRDQGHWCGFTMGSWSLQRQEKLLVEHDDDLQENTNATLRCFSAVPARRTCPLPSVLLAVNLFSTPAG